MVTLDKKTEKFLNIISPAIMEEFGDKEHDDNNKNKTDSNINNMN